MEDKGPFAHHAGPQGEDREQKPLPVLLPSNTPVGARLCCTFAWPLSFPSLSSPENLEEELCHIAVFTVLHEECKSFLEKKEKPSCSGSNETVIKIVIDIHIR